MVTKLFKGKKLYHFVLYILKKLLDFKLVGSYAVHRRYNTVENVIHALIFPNLFHCHDRSRILYDTHDGRIAGLINHAYNKKWGKNAIRFTRFDFIDDYEVSEALFNRVVEWGKAMGHDEIMGPIGFTDMDHEGMLIEGFDKFNMSITFYNHPYYLDHMARLGLDKAVDWIEYKLHVPKEIPEMIAKMAEHFRAKCNYELVKYTDRRVLYNDAFEAFRVVDEASSVLYGTVPLTDAVIKKAIDDYIPIVNLDYICSVKDKDGRVVGFSVMVPSIAKAVKRSNGKLTPLGIIRLLGALKSSNDTLEMYFVAVRPECQMCGVPLIMMNAQLESLIKNGARYCETGPMLETNKAVHGMWRYFDKEQHKKRRCYIKSI